MSENGDLITKYRPATFDEVTGQDAVVKSLRDVLKRQSARAFIFTGPSGVGKTTISRILAAEVGCRPANLVEVNAANATGIDDMRALLGTAAFAPLGGGTRVYIIDEAHQLSRQAFQSLLKPVEEPPPGVYFCFCTTESGRIPATIKTRCAEYVLKPVAKDVIYQLLFDVVAKEGMKTPTEVLYLIAEKAGGSIRQALRVLAQCHRARDRKEAATFVAAAADTGEGDIIELARALVRGGLTWPKAMHMLAPFKDEPAENLRYTIVAYLTGVLLGCKDDAAATRGLAILQAFSTPYPQGATASALVLSVGEVLYAE